MPRRREVPKRRIIPDPKFKDKLVTKFCSSLMYGGKKSVAEGILYPFMLDLFAAACEPLGIEVNYAVLTAPLPTVLHRVQARLSEPEHAAALADEKVVGDLWSQFEELGVDGRHRVDSSQGSPQSIADAIYARTILGELRL